MNVCLSLDPADTMIFRDGRPFNQDDAGRASAASLFPPPPVALYGAARVAAARGLGWTGIGNWTNPSSYAGADASERAGRAERILGSWKCPGSFAVAGPYFAVDVDGEIRPLLPVPAHVMARVGKVDGSVENIVALHPAPQGVETDRGSMRLLEMLGLDSGLKDEPLAGRWAYAEAVDRLLSGGTPTPEELGRPPPDPWRPNPTASKLPGWGWTTSPRQSRASASSATPARAWWRRGCCMPQRGGGSGRGCE